MVHLLHVQFLFIGTTELLLICGIALLFFGGKKLPEVMRGLGQGFKEFKQGINEVKREGGNNQLEQPSKRENTSLNEEGEETPEMKNGEQ